VSPPTNPPLLEARDAAAGDVSPTSAFVHVVLTGDRFFSGRVAFEKAEELRRLAAALAARGIPETALALEGASVDVTSGLFTKSSSVTYRVRITVEDLELLAGVLDAIGELKKASLTHLEWNYDDSAAQELEILRKAGERATAKARVLAAAVGATLGALHSVREEREGEPAHQAPVFAGAPMVMRARAASIADELGGLELAPKKKVTIRVIVAFTLASVP
jgi:uncharacterized protein YggE